jgi:starch synthase
LLAKTTPTFRIHRPALPYRSVAARTHEGYYGDKRPQIDTRDHTVRILQIASEAVPWVKTGGLADVVGALSSHLADAGHEIVLALPRYRNLRVADPAATSDPVPVAAGNGISATVIPARSEAGYGVWWIDSPALFDRDGIYGTRDADYPDNALRFAGLVRAALDATRAMRWQPDVIHAHDWQGALAPLFVREGPRTDPTARPATVLTVHNMAYQGWFDAEQAEEADLPDAPALVQGDGVGLLKGGILSADRVTTVSPRYALEIATPRFGFGLDPWISALEPPVAGILNGIDTDVWNPETDPHLQSNYGAADLSGKAACKAALQEAVALPVDPDIPLLGMVSRLVGQKGLSLIDALGDPLVERDAQFVFLGTGEERYERLVATLAARHANVAARVRFSESLAHQIEAGADFFLMPSEFEPCGLNQMISQRYGTPPIVHRVGGLADSVTHASPEALKAGEATGVVFDHFDPPALSWAVDFALELYARPAQLTAMRRAGMEADFSWRRSGLEYEELYRRTLEDTNGAG